MPEPKRNMGASVRARLLNLAKERNQPNDLLLTRYALERLLYRLSTTKHRERFVLKGAMLMTTWFEDPFRPTRDLDLLGFGDPDPEAMLAVFREICAVEIDDGVVFDVAGLAVDLIREELEYGGLRIKTNADIAGARVRVVIDIGFGDAIEPGATELELSGSARLAGTAPARLSARDRDCRKISGDGGARPRQQPDERPLRYLAPVPRLRIQGRRARARDCRDFRAAQDTCSC